MPFTKNLSYLLVSLFPQKNRRVNPNLICVLFCWFAFLYQGVAQHQNARIVTTDIRHFWDAFYMITTTKDSVLHYKYLDSLFLQKSSPGLEAIRQVRNYTPEDYISAIHNYPKFWKDVRKNTAKIEQYSNELAKGIDNLKKIYPDLRPATIYFTMGALRSNGTTLDNMVLIGSELALATKETPSDEFPEGLSHLKRYFETEPTKNLVYLNVHEYIHTQQKPMVYNILSMTIYEGVAEFIPEKALGYPTLNPQIAFGKKHAERIRQVFEKEMFYANNRNKWLNSNTPNEFGMRDLSYYVGYQICENYYRQAEDKSLAIKTMIELDYSNEEEIEAFVQESNYFSAPLDTLYQNFEKSRPYVTGIRQFANQSENVSTDINQITVEFSRPLNGRNTGVDFGPLGQEAFPKNDFHGRFWSEDRSSWTIPVQLEPNRHYQILISNNFRTIDDIPLQPFLIEFTTADK